MNESVQCKMCGCEQMCSEELKTASEWRYRYKCPVCGATTPKARTQERALSAALEYNRSRSMVWQAVGCPFYRRHNRRGKWVQCESPLPRGLVLTSSFPNGRALDAHMQKYCRSDASLQPMCECLIARLCQEKS